MLKYLIIALFFAVNYLKQTQKLSFFLEIFSSLMFNAQYGEYPMKTTRLTESLLSKIHAAITSDALRRRLMFFFLNAALSLIAFVMTVVNLFTAEYILLASTLAFSLLCLFNICALSFLKIPEHIIYCVFGAEAMALLAFFFISGIPNGFSALWICLIPSFALLVFGVRSGSIFSLLAMAMLVFLFWIPAGKSLLMFSYTETFMLRFPFLYCSIFLISLLIEYIRRETQSQLENAKQEYHNLYRRDALTGLYNRYGINEFISNTFTADSDNPISVIILDIDDFKVVNDVYGHEGGDEVLKSTASILSAMSDSYCQCCRWGGEEFLIVVQGSIDAAKLAEKARHEIEQAAILYNNHEIHITVSAGVFTADSAAFTNIHDFIGKADKALYQSKANGKNQVTVTCATV